MDADVDGADGRRGDTPEAAELDLVARLRARDEAAFEEVIRRFGPRLLAVARRMLGSEDEANDVLQDALVSALRSIDRFEGAARISTWLHSIVVNAALMRLRSRRRRPTESIDELLPRFDDTGHRIDVWCDGESPAEQVERSELLAVVRTCIGRLPEAHRTILLLRDVEQLETAVIAERLGITVNAAKIRLHRARQGLRTLVERAVGHPAH